jgi:RNA polymerase sigma-70 factor (ECF subfamily)
LPTVEQVYRSHAGVVRRALRSFGVDPAALDDAVQDVFVVLVRRSSDFEAGRSWSNWLWGIARRVARGYRRGAGRRDRLQAVLRRSQVGATPDDELARRRALEFIERFLAGLTAELFDAFVLAELEGFTAPEIAAQTGANLNTVYARIRAVRQRFDRAIADALEPSRDTGAWWAFGLPWWTPAATTAVVAITLGFAGVAPFVAPPTAIASVASPCDVDDVVPTDGAYRPFAPLALPAAVVAPPTEHPTSDAPKPRRARAKTPRGVVTDDAPIVHAETQAVHVEVQRPDGEHVYAPDPAPRGSLLKVRGHFLHELGALGG